MGLAKGEVSRDSVIREPKSKVLEQTQLDLVGGLGWGRGGIGALVGERGRHACRAFADWCFFSIFFWGVMVIVSNMYCFWCE